jgi:site-specific DNA-methyltransferase (adenine-specific)
MSETSKRSLSLSLSLSLLEGDCREQMKSLPDDSIDAVICDPPYNLAFMGKKWDTHINNAAYQEWTREWATEAFRVLKPGGHLLAFGGTRTYHRQTCGIEDAGFEIRDCVAWIYAVGFPKSHNISKAIDKAAGVEFSASPAQGVGFMAPDGHNGYNVTKNQLTQSGQSTPEAEQWEGWGTALKPAMEPIVVARKPFTGTVAANVLEHGTGALNIDASRIGSDTTRGERYGGKPPGGSKTERAIPGQRDEIWSVPAGRWPANILFDEVAAAVLDEQSGQSTSRKGKPRRSSNPSIFSTGDVGLEHNDKGGASRFFYVAKAAKKERNAGLDGFEEQAAAYKGYRENADDTKGGATPYAGSGRTDSTANKNNHPCVKPIQLLRYLSKLVTPPGGTILDPFMGSGSGGCAAVLEGFNYIGIEMEPEYLEIAKARIEHWQAHADKE